MKGFTCSWMRIIFDLHTITVDFVHASIVIVICLHMCTIVVYNFFVGVHMYKFIHGVHKWEVIKLPSNQILSRKCQNRTKKILQFHNLDFELIHKRAIFCKEQNPFKNLQTTIGCHWIYGDQFCEMIQSMWVCVSSQPESKLQSRIKHAYNSLKPSEKVKSQ